MIENLPNWIEILFINVAIAAIVLFYFSNGKPKLLTLILLFWGIIQSALAFGGFYQNDNFIPPRFLLVLIPTTFLIIYGLSGKRMTWARKNRNNHVSTFIHTLRIPIEIVLLYLFLNKMIPQLMTFEGRNFDILVGISAPIIGILHLKNMISPKGLMAWNIVGLGFVSFIYLNGVLSSELPFQQFGFEQPNIAVTYFPFILLPALVVPIVIYTHVTDILFLKESIRLDKQKNIEK